MPGNRRSLRRQGDRPRKKVFVIATEGKVTEPEYFKHLRKHTNCVIRVLRPKGSEGSDPARVLRRIKRALIKEPVEPEDEAWVVVDRDQWPEDALDRIQDWQAASRHSNHGFALSNPNFEYWLLLHFEDGAKVASLKERLNRHLPGYEKGIDPAKFTVARIGKAIDRARQRYGPRRRGWPRSSGQTTVYRLVERIIGD